jgi:hypothetical protein
MSLHNLAGLLQAQGDLAGARPLYERALAICERVLGPEHPNSGRTRSSYAHLLLSGSDPEAARVQGEAALTAHEKALGLKHSWTGDSARVTADALAALSRTQEADAIRMRYGID